MNPGVSKILEIELSKLQANAYNPRTTMDKKGLASLEKSLERDGQLQTILVRPIDGNKYEVVAGMRRFLSLKSLGEKKAMCTVMEMDDQTAMQRAFKENAEREPLSPVDEAAWFFKMLGLKEEQLFTSKQYGTDTTSKSFEVVPLPTETNPQLKALASTLDGSITSHFIEDRLPLLALPDSMQRQVDDGIPVEKAKVLARLRLIGDKKDAQEQMLAIWKNWGTKDLESLNEQVNITLENAKKKSEQVEKELKTIEDNLRRRIKNLNEEFAKVVEWVNPKSAKGLWSQIPQEVRDALAEKVELDTTLDKPDDAFEFLDEVITSITRDNTLDERVRDIREQAETLFLGQKHLRHDECAYCGTKVDSNRLKERIRATQEEIHGVEESIKKKKSLRDRTEEVQRELGDALREFNTVNSKFEAALKVLVDSKKLTKAEADERRKQMGGGQ
jgi:ParB/RepB/Spo0J family partition protein